MGRDHWLVAADRDPVRAGLAGRADRQSRRDPLVEPGRGAAGARWHWAGGNPRRRWRLGLAQCGVGVRSELAIVRLAGRESDLTVVAARAALARPAVRTAGRVLDAVA